MKRNDVVEILNKEQLIFYNFFEDRDDASDEMVIKSISGKYVVYATNERAAKVAEGEREFDNESEALENFVRRLRALNRYRSGN